MTEKDEDRGPSGTILDFELGEVLSKFADELEKETPPAPDLREYDPQSDQDMLDFMEDELGVKLRAVPVVGAIFLRILHAVQKREMVRAVIIGPRSGGKTYLAAAIQVMLWRHFGYDCQNVGGSFEQAEQCYAYIGDAANGSEDIHEWTVVRTRKRTLGKDGGRIRVSTASQRSVRGPHPNGPSGGGLLFLDEAAKIAEDVYDAAKFQLGSADPSALIQASTMGEEQVGRFWEVVSDPKSQGYDLMRWDKFDVAQRCEYDCATTCPVKDHFYGNHHQGEDPGFYRDLGGGKRELIHRAYCAGKAHDVDGWIRIDEIAQEWRENPREVFERENMGIATGVVGHVFDPISVTAACVDGYWLSRNRDQEEHDARFLLLEKKVGLDWGWAGMAAACYAVRVKDVLVVYRWEVWDHVQYRRIRKHMVQVCHDERVNDIIPDSAEPSENDAMREDCSTLAEREYERNGVEHEVTVAPMVFSKWKTYAYGQTVNRLEKGGLLFPREFGGRPVPNHDLAMRMLKGHRKDTNGKPAKVEDHVSDALACCAVGFSRRWRSQGVAAVGPR